MNLDSNIKIKIKQATKDGYIVCCNGGVADFSYPSSKLRRGRVQGGGNICPTIATAGGLCRVIVEHNGDKYEIMIRKLTETEAFILMGFTKDDVDKCKAMGVSKTQLYRCAGNSIVTNCVKLLAQHLYKAQCNPDYICEDEIMVSQGYGV